MNKWSTNQNGSANFEAPGNNKVKNFFNVPFAPVRVRFRLKVFEKKGTYICDKGYKFISLREKQGCNIFRLLTFILKSANTLLIWKIGPPENCWPLTVGHKRPMATTRQSFHLWSLLALSETLVAMTTRESKEGVRLGPFAATGTTTVLWGEAKVRLFSEMWRIKSFYPWEKYGNSDNTSNMMEH